MSISTTGWGALCVVAALVVGCGGGSGEGLDSNGRPIGEGDDPDGPMTPTFSSIQSHVFTPMCTGCHSGGAAPRGLRLDAANSYAMLVNVPSVGVPSLMRVEPGNAADSYLVHKLEGTASVGAQMPLGGPYLDADAMAIIRQWINEGAQP